jgi:hypothetical protein
MYGIRLAYIMGGLYTVIYLYLYGCSQPYPFVVNDVQLAKVGSLTTYESKVVIHAAYLEAPKGHHN